MLRAKLPDCSIVVATNGILLNTDAKREAALNLSIIRLSLHGVSDEMVQKYMLRGSFEKAYAAMKEMVAYRDARGLRRRSWNGNICCSTGTTTPKHPARHRAGEGGERGHHYVRADAQSVLRHVLALPSRPHEPYWPHQLEGARSDPAAGKCRVKRSPGTVRGNFHPPHIAAKSASTPPAKSAM